MASTSSARLVLLARHRLAPGEVDPGQAGRALLEVVQQTLGNLASGPEADPAFVDGLGSGQIGEVGFGRAPLGQPRLVRLGESVLQTEVLLATAALVEPAVYGADEHGAVVGQPLRPHSPRPPEPPLFQMLVRALTGMQSETVVVVPRVRLAHRHYVPGVVEPASEGFLAQWQIAFTGNDDGHTSRPWRRRWRNSLNSAIRRSFKSQAEGTSTWCGRCVPAATHTRDLAASPSSRNTTRDC